MMTRNRRLSLAKLVLAAGWACAMQAHADEGSSERKEATPATEQRQSAVSAVSAGASDAASQEPQDSLGSAVFSPFVAISAAPRRKSAAQPWYADSDEIDLTMSVVSVLLAAVASYGLLRRLRDL